MCGICGLASLDGAASPDPAVLARMNETLVHRGPDSEGSLVDGPVGLAMRRLSIIDLAGGDQPIANEDGTVHVVLNGEIYNYRELMDGLAGADPDRGRDHRQHRASGHERPGGERDVEPAQRPVDRTPLVVMRNAGVSLRERPGNRLVLDCALHRAAASVTDNATRCGAARLAHRGVSRNISTRTFGSRRSRVPFESRLLSSIA